MKTIKKFLLGEFNMKKIETDCLIIGAGVTGLMMAKCLKSDYLIVEKEKN